MARLHYQHNWHSISAVWQNCKKELFRSNNMGPCLTWSPPTPPPGPRPPHPVDCVYSEKEDEALACSKEAHCGLNSWLWPWVLMMCVGLEQVWQEGLGNLDPEHFNPPVSALIEHQGVGIGEGHLLETLMALVDSKGSGGSRQGLLF